MVAKGIIKSIDFNGNSCVVRMPYFETAGSSEVVCEALISNAPGVYNGYKENDVVWVAFENGTMEAPVVIGKLYLGAAKEKQDPRGTINCVDSTISGTATIPSDTKLKNDLDSSQINTKIPYRSLESIANNLNRVDVEQGQNNRDLGNRLRTVVDGIGPDGSKIYSLIEQTTTDIRNEVVHKSSKTEPGYNDTKKMGWELNLNGWDVYSEYENLIALENNITLSVQKSLTKDINTIFINNTDTEITPQEMCGNVILEFIKKPGLCNGNTGRWVDETDPDNPIVYYSYESRAEKKDPDTGAITKAEYKCLEMSKFLKTFFGQANAKYLDGLTYDDSKSIGNTTRTSEQLQYREYYINYDSSEDINQGWCVFFDTSEIGHELTFKIVYYEEKNNPSTTIKPITVKVKAMLLFKDENEASIDLNNRYWSLVSYYNINSSTQTRFAPVNFLRTPISDKTNTLVGINRNGLYVNGTVAAKSGSIGEFIIGGTHSCEDLNKDIASGIYSKNYVKRFEDQPTKGQMGVYVGTDGIKIGDKFSVSADGKVRGSGFEITLDDTAQKELQIVNKNYQDGNTKLEDIYANEKSGHIISVLDSSDRGSSSRHTVSYDLDLNNKVSAETMEYSLKCPSASVYSLLAMPLLLKNSGTLFVSEENYVPWTISFKVKKADFENHSAGIPAANSSKKLFVFLGTLESSGSGTGLKFDTLPARYYTYKNFSSCNTYTAVRDEGGITADINTPTIDAGTKKFRATLNYNDYYGSVTYENNPLNPTGSKKVYSDYIKSYPSNVTDKIYIWGYNANHEWTRIPITTYLQDKGYTTSGLEGPQTVGTSCSFSSCNVEYESYYSAYLLAEVTQDKNIVHETEDPEYSVVAITLDRRYYNIYNSLKDDLRLGICYFDPNDSKVPLLVKEFKFEKSKVYSDYTVSDYDAYAVASNSKTITISDLTEYWYNEQTKDHTVTFPMATDGVRAAYHIKKNDVVLVQGTIEVSGQQQMFTVCYIEANDTGNLSGACQFKFITSSTAEIATNTKYKYYATTNDVSPSDSHGQPIDKEHWSDNFIEPNGTKPYVWGSSVTTVSKTGQADVTTWSTPTKVATYDGLLTILSTRNVNLVQVDISTDPNTYYLRGDVITGALGDKVKIGGDRGFTINPSRAVTNDGQTTYTPAAIYHNISSINTTGTGVYIGTDGIKIGENFKVTGTTASQTGNCEIAGYTKEISKKYRLAKYDNENDCSSHYTDWEKYESASWQTEIPTRADNMYIWEWTRISRTAYGTLKDQTTDKRVCLTGTKGDQGTPGRSLTESKTYYSLQPPSYTANIPTDADIVETPAIGKWSLAPQEFDKDLYSGYNYWTAERRVYSNPTETIWNNPVMASMLTADFINSFALQAKKVLITNSSGTLLDAGWSQDDQVKIGGFTVGTNALYSPDTFNSMDATGDGVYIGTDGIRLGPKDSGFWVKSDGQICGTGLNIQLTDKQKEELKGEPGADGKDGTDGKDGKDGSDASVTWENTCAALGITGDAATSKGIYTIDDKLIINATAIRADWLAAGQLAASSGTIGNLTITGNALTCDQYTLNANGLNFTSGVLTLNNNTTIYSNSTGDYIENGSARPLYIRNGAGAGIKFSDVAATDYKNAYLKLDSLKVNYASKKVAGTNNQYEVTTYNITGTLALYDANNQRITADTQKSASVFVTLNERFLTEGAKNTIPQRQVTYSTTVYLPAGSSTQNFTITPSAGGVGAVWFEHEPSGSGMQSWVYSVVTSINGGVVTNTMGSGKSDPPSIYGVGSSVGSGGYAGGTIAGYSVPVKIATVTNNILYSLGSIYPETTNKYYLGSANNKWEAIYCETGTIQTSDAKSKHNIEALNFDNANGNKYNSFFDALKPSSYKLNNGQSNRTHIGYIAQEVEQALWKAELTSNDFGGYISTFDENEYKGLRYEEFIALNTWQIQKLKKELLELKTQIAELKNRE